MTRKHSIAIHEAGHAVAAILHDIPFEHVTIVPTDEYNGCVRMEQPPAEYIAEETKDSPASLDYWHRRLIATMAGPAATKKLHPYGDWHRHAWADVDVAGDIFERIHERFDEAVIQAHLKYIKALAASFVENNWKEIEAVAAALIEHGTLSGDQVRSAAWPQAQLKCQAQQDGARKNDIKHKIERLRMLWNGGRDMYRSFFTVLNQVGLTVIMGATSTLGGIDANNARSELGTAIRIEKERRGIAAAAKKARKPKGKPFTVRR
jgi:hypothetical protein